MPECAERGAQKALMLHRRNHMKEERRRRRRSFGKLQIHSVQ
jgi:hypothetical protein